MLSDAYLRKSTADAGKSVERQERGWLADCRASGYEQGRAFVDPELSASRYARKPRPSYTELVEHIAAGACQMVALWEASRGARTMGEWVTFLDLCRDHQVLIRIYGGGDPTTYDPRRQRDREALLQDGIRAEGESERLSGRVRDGVQDSIMQGKPPGPLLFGYRRIFDSTGKFQAQEINPETAKIVRQLAQDTLAGKSLNGQARQLNEAGIPSPRGKQWFGSHISVLLRNPGYAPATPDSDRAQRIHKGKVVGDAVWEPILSYDQHRALCRLLGAPGRAPTWDSSLRYYLSNAALCGKCGEKLRMVYNNRSKKNYACVTDGCRGVSAPLEAMEASVSAMIRERLQQPDAGAIFVPQVDSAELAAAQREVDEWEDHLAEYRALARAKKITAASFAEVEAAALPEIEKARQRVRALETPATLAAYADLDVPAIWPDLEPAVQREFVLALAEITLAPVGRSGSRKWSPWRLAGSRWIGDQLTWGDHWQMHGLDATT